MDLSGKILNNRYIIEEILFHGEMSTIYTARDSEKNIPVAIKILNNTRTSNRAENIIRFRSEARAAAMLDHPNIIKVYDVGEFIGLHYIVMEYIAGKSLHQVLATRNISLEESLDIIVQLCRALHCIHEKNIIHRDIKPSNILIADAAGTIKLIDFGIAHIRFLNRPMTYEEIAGTFGYISIEQIGISKRPVDERSDLYAAGVILYQLLTGKLPFTGNTLSTLINNQVTGIPEKPGALNPDVPEILSTIVLKLLEKEPESRYQSAAGLIADLEKVQSGQVKFIPGLKDSAMKLSFRTKLIGRDREYEALKGLIDYASSGIGSVCFIKGEAGSGKTRLIEEIREYAMSKDGVLIEGKCYEDENTDPFGPFKEILTKYIQNYYHYNEEKKNDIADDLKSEYSNLGRILVNLCAPLYEILGECPTVPALDPTKELERYYMTVSGFLKRLSTHEKCFIIVFDDLHGADEGTLYLLKEAMRNIASFPLMIIGLYRDDEYSLKPGLLNFLKGIEEEKIIHSTISLDFLGFEETHGLISGLLYESKDYSTDISRFIFNKTKGNPFFSIMILRQLIDEKILYHSDRRWLVDNDKLQEIEIPLSIVDAIIKKFHFLNENDEKILTFAAVLGEDFSVSLLSELSDMATTDIVSIIDKAISLQILETTMYNKRRVCFVHDRIKEAFYEDIEEEKKKELHLLAAGTLEKFYEDNIDEKVFNLAYHYFEAGDENKFITYAFPAGLKAKENYANEDAINYFLKIIEILERANPLDTMLIRCKEELGNTYLTIGECDKAIDIFEDILSLIDDKIKKASIYKEITSAFYRKSNWEACETNAALGLSLLKEQVPRSKHRVILGIIKEALLHIIFRLWKGTKRNPHDIRFKLITGFLESLSVVYALSDVLKLVRANLRMINISFKHLGETQEFATAQYGLGSICMAIPIFPMADRYLSQSIAIHDRLGNAWSKGRAVLLMGYKLEFQGRFEEANLYLQQGYEIFKTMGDIKETGFALNGLEHNYYYMADYKKAKELNDLFCDIGHNTQDSYYITTSYIYYAQLYREQGNLEMSEKYARESKILSAEKKLLFNVCSAHIELGCTALAMGDTETAIINLERARDLHEKENFLKQYVILVYYNLAQAYIDEYTKKEHLFSRGKRRIYRNKIKKACKRAVKKTRLWATHYGSTLRVMANCYALLGNQKKAEKYFKQSIYACNKVGRKYEHARCLYEYGLFLTQTDVPHGSKSYFESAFKIFTDINANLFIERLSTLLGINRDEKEADLTYKLLHTERYNIVNNFLDEISSTGNSTALMKQILVKAVELSGAQRGYIFIENKNSGDLDLRSYVILGAHDRNYSRRIISSVFKGGEAVISINASDEQKYIDHNTIISSKLKSIVCLPIISKDKTIGVCYLDNPLTSGIFTDDIVEMLKLLLSRTALEVENMLNREKTPAKKSETSRQTLTDATKEKLDKAISYMKENFLSDISREGLAAFVDINPDYMGKAFKAYTGMRISGYINDLRINDAAERLLHTDETILDIAYAAGFESISTFRRAFFKKMKLSPQKYRQQQNAEK